MESVTIMILFRQEHNLDGVATCWDEAFSERPGSVFVHFNFFWLTGWLLAGWLAGWLLAGWLAGWPPGWLLAGSLAGWPIRFVPQLTNNRIGATANQQ